MKPAQIKFTDSYLSITFFDFPSHVKISDSQRARKGVKTTYNKETKKTEKEVVITNEKKVGKPRFTKINGQSMYNGSWNDFTKGKVVNTIKEYFRESLKDQDLPKIPKYPIITSGIFAAPKNYGLVKIINGEINLPKSGKANWDIENQSSIWSKCFNDFIQEIELIPNDDVNHVIGSGGLLFLETPWENRHITFFLEYDNFNKISL
jgi:hypothetical protein